MNQGPPAESGHIKSKGTTSLSSLGNVERHGGLSVGPASQLGQIDKSHSSARLHVGAITGAARCVVKECLRKGSMLLMGVTSGWYH